MSLSPLPEVTRPALSATVNKRKGGWLASGSETLSNTPQGPEKSITFSPAEMSIATGMLPLAGAGSFHFSVGMPFTSPVVESLGASARADGSTSTPPRVVAAAIN
jgi:hypothetical protein